MKSTRRADLLAATGLCLVVAAFAVAVLLGLYA